MPKMSKTLCDAMIEQIRKEFASAYLYLNMSAQCRAQNLKGAAHWLRRQWEEELEHAMKLMDYVIDRGHPVALKALDEPTFKFENMTKTFDTALKHEQSVTASIFKLFQQAAEEKDYAAQTFLQWFVTEQVEEENSAQEIIETLRVAGDQGTALLMVDRRLAERQ